MFYFISILLHINFALDTFSRYLNTALIGGNNTLLIMYRIGASTLFILILLLIYLPKEKRKA
jgi:hypothetical protein